MISVFDSCYNVPFLHRDISPYRQSLHRMTARQKKKNCTERKVEGRTGVGSQRNYGCRWQVVVHFVRTYQFRRLHAAHEGHGNVHLASHTVSGFRGPRKPAAKLTRMTSNGRLRCTRALNASTASDPFSAISTVCPYFSNIFTASFWFTKLSSASRMSKITSFVAAAGLTVLDSSADISAEARSCTLTGVVTSELMLLSRHHFTIPGPC